MNPDADYKLVVEYQRKMEEQAAALAHGEPRIVSVVAALADRLRAARA